jgi:BirA family transcriptional regulator, biotin operon repressor / biotin---[acetyl-CoA-carboxylase] ligase
VVPSIDIDRLLAARLVGAAEHHAEIDSTQTRAHALAAQLASAELPYLIAADQQTAGRGRGDNRWWTGAGSLAFSLIFDPSGYGLDRPLRPARSLAAGVALVDAVAPLLDGASSQPLGLHWPNDVFVGQRKLAGILIDVIPGGRHILGLGLNTNNRLEEAPAEVRMRAVSLCELLGREIDSTLVLMSFCEHLDAALRLSVQDPPALGRRFQELCLQIGQRLTVDAAGTVTTGYCLGIATDGALLLETGEGPQRVYSGALRH